MLNDDQIRELLSRCELVVGRELRQIRGNLRVPETRSAAIWELLVLDAVAQRCIPEYEKPLSNSNSAPDFYLPVPSGGGFFLEATYLDGRFIDNDRRLNEFLQRVYQALKRRNIPPNRIGWRADGKKTDAGYLRKLPQMNEAKRVAQQPPLKTFLNEIVANSATAADCDLRPKYTINFRYDPNAGEYISGGGLLEEVPRVVKEHAVYRILESKDQQHKAVKEGYVVCIGGDRSPALKHGGIGTGVIGQREAIWAAFREFPRLSAVLSVSIKTSLYPLRDRDYYASPNMYINPEADHPLSTEQADVLNSLDFNRWRYSRPRNPWKVSKAEEDSRRYSGGDVVTSLLTNGLFTVEIPSPLVVDVLAGKVRLVEALKLSPNDQLSIALEQGWDIVHVELLKGDMQNAQSAKMKLTLSPIQKIF